MPTQRAPLLRSIPITYPSLGHQIPAKNAEHNQRGEAGLQGRAPPAEEEHLKDPGSGERNRRQIATADL